jgi:hypothetical protein
MDASGLNVEREQGQTISTFSGISDAVALARPHFEEIYNTGGNLLCTHVCSPDAGRWRRRSARLLDELPATAQQRSSGQRRSCTRRRCGGRCASTLPLPCAALSDYPHRSSAHRAAQEPTQHDDRDGSSHGGVRDRPGQGSGAHATSTATHRGGGHLCPSTRLAHSKESRRQHQEYRRLLSRLLLHPLEEGLPQHGAEGPSS